MAVATVNLAINNYPKGTDNTQRMQRHYGLATFLGASPSYVQGGLRINFASLEPVKVSPQNLLPAWMDFDSQGNTGYFYEWNPLGAGITLLALTANVVTITAKNNLAAGDIVQLNGLTVNPTLNGKLLTVLAGGLSATSFTANLTNANIGSAAETGFVLPITYVTGLPFLGNLQIFQGPSAVTSPNPLLEIPTAALPASIVGSATVTADVIAFRADFARI